jgi:predicted  nucleic acid-binding Zn-ribbon protein
VAQLARQEELIRSQADELAKLKSEKTDLVKKLMELARAYGA